MIKEQTPPSSPEIEEAILGAIILDSSCLNVAMGKLFEDMFYRIDSKAVFKAIAALYDASLGVDLFTVVEELKRQNKLEEAGGTYGVVTSP